MLIHHQTNRKSVPRGTSSLCPLIFASLLLTPPFPVPTTLDRYWTLAVMIVRTLNERELKNVFLLKWTWLGLRVQYSKVSTTLSGVTQVKFCLRCCSCCIPVDWLTPLQLQVKTVLWRYQIRKSIVGPENSNTLQITIDCISFWAGNGKSLLQRRKHFVMIGSMCDLDIVTCITNGQDLNGDEGARDPGFIITRNLSFNKHCSLPAIKANYRG